jgi:hypothetical protein
MTELQQQKRNETPFFSFLLPFILYRAGTRQNAINRQQRGPQQEQPQAGPTLPSNNKIIF